MSRKCFILTLTLMVALAGIMRFDGESLSKSAGHKSVAKVSQACPIQRSLLRTHRGSDLSRLSFTQARFVVLDVSTVHGGQTLATSASLSRWCAALRAMNLQSLCVKLQV